MPIRVDLPAPFSPTMPWTVPGRTAREMSRLAWTAPNDLSMPRSSMTGGAAPGESEARSPALIRLPFARSRPGGPGREARRPPPAVLLPHVVGDLDLAGPDVGARLLEPLLHLRGDQAPVVLVDRVPDAALGDPQVAHAGLPGPVLGGLEGLVDREVDALDHRGEDRARVEVVLVRVHADGELALVLGRLEHA